MRPSGERELRGHSSIVYRLATVPTADGVLLASGDTQGGVLLWDGQTGERLTEPVTVDGVTVSDLAAVNLGADGWALACCGSDGVTLWDPRRIGQPGYVPRRLLDTGTSALAVIPSEPQLIVLAGVTAVTVIDPASGREVFSFPQPPHPKGHIGDQVYRLAGVRFDDETAGFVAARYGGALEMWEPAGNVWRQRSFSLGVLGRGVLTAFDTRLAITARRGVEVWDLKTGERTARGELDTPFEVLAPVQLGQQTVIAAAFRDHHECGVQLWDPQDPAALSAVFNRHGPAFGDPRLGGATINAVTSIACPDGKTRVASAGNDGCVLISAPLDEHDLVAGQRPGPAPPQGGGGNFARVRTSDGEIVGLWFARTGDARDRGLIEAVLFREDLGHLLGAEHRVVPNTYDDSGGAFVMFGHHLAPGEPGHA
ncbi:WD40 repeat domain-containing protein [Nonomuraea sp. NPDC049400]|uniref:WD40 repeat domain-containing protein n=1 Tax=Nonomuraea sp. NPDC049400 TaxID=3364352 RepID=UPI00378B74E8